LDYRVMQEDKVPKALLVFRVIKGIEVLRVIKAPFLQPLVSRAHRVISDHNHQVLLDLLDPSVYRARLVQSQELRVIKVHRDMELQHRARVVNRALWVQTIQDILEYRDHKDSLVQPQVQQETRDSQVQLHRDPAAQAVLKDTRVHYLEPRGEYRAIKELRAIRELLVIKDSRVTSVLDHRDLL
jgi:hypothetical protein